MSKTAISSPRDIINDIAQGRPVILMDDETRENEGDIVIAADAATPDMINFMAKEARGLICLALTKQRVKTLQIPLMSNNNATQYHTNFTVSIEAREGVTTGISAHDRAKTIAIAIDDTKTANDIVTPGHVFPLVAKDGGVLVRAGHTEAAVDLARLAGRNPSGVICEIMNEDGTMARLPDLIPFAEKHGLKIGTIADLIAYRRQHDHLLQRVLKTKIATPFAGDFDAYVYKNKIDGFEHIALVKGDLSSNEPMPVRVHVMNSLNDLLGIQKSRYGQVEAVLKHIAHHNRGICILLHDSFMQKYTMLLDVKNHQQIWSKTLKEYGIGVQILLDLGVHNMIVLSNSSEQNLVALEGYGIKLCGYQGYPLV
jgi:3,4-dihydroxy 2-butanone 4-phosphate synthase/GTP cyclohydrolase II